MDRPESEVFRLVKSIAIALTIRIPIAIAIGSLYAWSMVNHHLRWSSYATVTSCVGGVLLTPVDDDERRLPAAAAMHTSVITITD